MIAIINAMKELFRLFRIKLEKNKTTLRMSIQYHKYNRDWNLLKKNFN